MVDDATNVLDVGCHLPYILDGFREVQVDDVISIIGDSNFIPIDLVVGRTSHPQDRLATLAGWKCSNLSHGVFMAEGSDFDRDGEARAKTISQLRFVDYIEMK